MKGFFKRFTTFFKVYHTTKLFLILLLLSLVILLIVDYKWIHSSENLKDFIGNVLVEAHGVLGDLGDLIIFGVILTIYDTYRNNKEEKRKKKLERKTKVERLKEEIDDFRIWEIIHILMSIQIKKMKLSILVSI
ncbi:hypothetical protein [Thalassobellus citreus]|uniref:hypothetical protein n=1 Tax=Thalassobellus citreus TaxID=3367752 RepID=UPI0037AD675C